MDSRVGSIFEKAILAIFLMFAMGSAHFHAVLYYSGVPRIGTVTASKLHRIDGHYERFNFLDDGTYTDAPMGQKVPELCLPSGHYCEVIEPDISREYQFLLGGTLWGVFPLTIAILALMVPVAIAFAQLVTIIAVPLRHVLGRNDSSSAFDEIIHRTGQTLFGLCISLGSIKMLVDLWPMTHYFEGQGIVDKIVLGFVYAGMIGLLSVVALSQSPLIRFVSGETFQRPGKFLGSVLVLYAGSEVAWSIIAGDPITMSNLVPSILDWLGLLAG
ncbi:MAG: hypothetical protein ABW184_17870 [Sphingobium sp.]